LCSGWKPEVNRLESTIHDPRCEAGIFFEGEGEKAIGSW
jgi:hypothetical protein